MKRLVWRLRFYRNRAIRRWPLGYPVAVVCLGWTVGLVGLFSDRVFRLESPGSAAGVGWWGGFIYGLSVVWFVKYFEKRRRKRGGEVVAAKISVYKLYLLRALTERKKVLIGVRGESPN